jgi:hypothetical protein
MYLGEVFMPQLEEIEQDILDFLSKVDDLRHSDRKQILTLLFKKHLITNQGDVMISYNDLQQVLSNAKMMYAQEAFPVRLRDDKNALRELSPSEVGHYCVVECVISLLNRKEALKRLPVFKKGDKNGQR